MSPFEIQTLIRLNQEHPDWFFNQIAQKMKCNPVHVQYAARKLGLKSQGKKGAWNRKHQHLQEKALTYFLTHSRIETQNHFKLTHSEFKSLFTCAYRKPEFSHLRKDTRRKDAWSLKEMLFLIQNAGIRERAWVSQQLNRGCSTNIKERLRKWNASSKHLNGMPVSWARELWPEASLSRRIHTQAGPSGNLGIWRFKLVSWWDCLKYSKKYPTPPMIQSGIRAMLKFQKFIYQTQSTSHIKRKINQRLAMK